MVSVSGQFSNVSQAATPLWAPNGTWALSFDVNSSPTVTYPTTLSFDPQVSNFTYSLNGKSVAATLNYATFFTTNNSGLFSLYFNGSSAPEFDFSGAQAFSGTTSSPTFSAGTYAVTGWDFTDSTGTYDSKAAPSSVVTLAPVPEPSSLMLLGLPMFSLAFERVRRLLVKS